MNKSTLMSTEEVAMELGISKSFAYKMVHQLNDELKKQGYITIAGKVNRLYFQEKIYCGKGEMNAGI